MACERSTATDSANRSQDGIYRLWLQVEALSRFVVGSLDIGPDYEDDIRVIALNNLKSLSGFWFDGITSIPWSWMDLQMYTVQPMRPTADKS
jgi:hypothetical protein